MTISPVSDAQDLAIPIYLDANALLDLLASLEDGFSMVEKVATSESSADERRSRVSGEFGVANVLSLLKINLGASRDARSQSGSDTHTERERYHTYGSLLHRLRETLASSGAIKTIENEDNWEGLKPSDFIELRGVLRPNPLGDSLNTVIRLMRLFRLIAGIDSAGSSGKSGGGRKGQRRGAGGDGPDPQIP